MKAVLVSFCMWFLLVSCTGWDTTSDANQNSESSQAENEISQEQVPWDPTQAGWDSMSVSQIFSSIPQKYNNDAEFSMCLQNTVDGCISTAHTLEDGGQQMNCDDFIMQANKDACKNTQAISEAIESWDVSKCEPLWQDAPTCQLEVIMSQAIEQSDASICKQLDDENMQISCNNQVVQNQARTSKDPSMCDKMIIQNEGDDFEIQFCKDEVSFAIEEEKIQQQQAEEQAKLEQELQQQQPEISDPVVDVVVEQTPIPSQ